MTREPASAARAAAGVSRLCVRVSGVVQGVGYRPFVYRAATALGLTGWVRNESDGVRIEVQGDRVHLDAFLGTLRSEAPPPAQTEGMEVVEVGERDEQGFRILESQAARGPARPSLPADLGTCAACLAEMDTPGERRFRYPFTNCTRCGPRYTIVEGLPYDRPRTSMKGFAMCPACIAEYHDPADRRFHAEPVACPRCGPALRLVGPDGRPLAIGEEALRLAAAAVIGGRVLALKGLGGFQLLVDSTAPGAVALLRQRKGREEKPFAVMFPSLESVCEHCEVSAEEMSALTSAEAPIVLVRRRSPAPDQGHRPAPLQPLAHAVAPGNPRIGALLPYTPLHHLLVGAAGRPLICTSGNLSGEPMCTHEKEALTRLGPVADVFLLHDRPIVRPVDDSVARIGLGGLELLRRARGFAPLPLRLGEATPAVLALGGHLKSTVAAAFDGQVVVSQHLGDLDTAEGVGLLERTAGDLVGFFDVQPEVIACDLHPDYASTRLAERLGVAWRVPVLGVQHHHAHVAACMAEHALAGPVLGFAWDGAGYGPDRTVWGGEALVCEGADYRRVAHLRPFPLPGGERAAREGGRAAVGLLSCISVAAAAARARQWFGDANARTLLGMIARSVNTPLTTGVGRLFDAVAALCGLRIRSGFEGQAAMELEFAAEGVRETSAYCFGFSDGAPIVVDWEPLVVALLEDLQRGVPLSVISARFHNALVAFAEEVACRTGIPRVALGGGCFQNLRLAILVRARLEARGFAVFTPQRFPPNDGGLALGQALIASRWWRNR